MVELHKDYGSSEFAYSEVVKAWQTLTGSNSRDRYFFVARLENPLEGGEWMAYLRRPDKNTKEFVDVPILGRFLFYEGFLDEGDAEGAIFDRAYKGLGWRISEINVDSLPSILEDV